MRWITSLKGRRMRLIDADALTETFTKWFGTEMNKDEKKARTISLAIAMINDCESVDAIPVEWIERWDERMNTDFYDEVKKKVFYDNQFEPPESVRFRDLPFMYTVVMMLKDWRKENGLDADEIKTPQQNLAELSRILNEFYSSEEFKAFKEEVFKLLEKWKHGS